MSNEVPPRANLVMLLSMVDSRALSERISIAAQLILEWCRPIVLATYMYVYVYGGGIVIENYGRYA